MKKLSIYLLILGCLFITGCGEDKVKEVATIDEFDTAVMSKNFSISDEDKYPDVDYILDYSVAYYDGNGNGYSDNDTTDILIEMVKYSDSDYADKAQSNHIESFNLLKTTAAYEENDKGSNYYRYVLVSNNRYMISVRVDDTLVFCKTMLQNKELVDEIFDEIDY